MAHAVVWFNIVAFTLMFVGFGYSYIGYLGGRRPWLRTYLIYFAAYAGWLLLATYHYFGESFLLVENRIVHLVIGWTRTAVSMGMAWTAPLIVLQYRNGKASAPQHLLAGIAPAVILAVAVVYTRTEWIWLALSLNLCFNIFMALVGIWGLGALRAAVPDPRAVAVRAFFLLTIVMYAVFFGYVVLLQYVRSDMLPATNVAILGVFGLAWSVIVIDDQVRRAKASAREGITLPALFLREYRITPREAAIVELLLDGKTTKEAGQILFVSHRTVETHARNIYRKCGVSNRMGLAKLVESCRRP
jgi:DNA-binding CsgD family transcriptional regulator